MYVFHDTKCVFGDSRGLELFTLCVCVAPSVTRSERPRAFTTEHSYPCRSLLTPARWIPILPIDVCLKPYCARFMCFILFRFYIAFSKECLCVVVVCREVHQVTVISNIDCAGPDFVFHPPIAG